MGPAHLDESIFYKKSDGDCKNLLSLLLFPLDSEKVFKPLLHLLLFFFFVVICRFLLKMNSLGIRLAKHLRITSLSSSSHAFRMTMTGQWYSTLSTESDNDEGLNDRVNDDRKNEELDDEFDDFLGSKPDLELQGVDPKRGWGFRGVHKAIICGKVGQVPVQKILRNGKNVTIFTVGTGGMFDQRIMREVDMPRPAQWHRIAVHNDILGAYAVQQLFKNSSVYVEGNIETRVYNDSITGEVKSIPEICVRHDGKLRLIKGGESINSNSLDELREGLF
ncbi:single-stranded DNA-binding protein, mitochondrial [Arachis duranensis]|uniref:Single-stranded DNA-binding protein, mitochondrial n=1 Tax=Arachis duranensis TaxID=130453 RepID=A0A6P4C1F8_ARADU|nr:single-stranded DNA-binding protein, mitochondrial [Arachis duranensis]XP_025618954.1 single-stranded DNA-binding protein, mitochondrial isoform X2 [Arachis hypogaea]QHO34385.1 Single-stranded DNA-binding protein [Arachis hypogaea]